MSLTQTNEKVGSVGAVWPPRFDRHNNRIKGFHPKLVDNRGQLREMFGLVELVKAQHKAATRTTIRAFVRKELVESIRRDPVQGQPDIEAVVPVDNAVPGYGMVYFGKNTQERMPDKATFRAEMESLERMRAIGLVSRDNALLRVNEAGYSLSSVDGNGQRETDIARLYALYREAYELYTFDITPDTIADMLSNGNLVIVARDRQSDIASSLIAEHCAIKLEAGPLVHLYEMSDYATFRADRKNGLITAMQIEAIRAIQSIHEGTAVVYAEDRAAWEAVNRSSQRAGMYDCGTLLQHCALVSDRSFGELGIYENFNVWAVRH